MTNADMGASVLAMTTPVSSFTYSSILGARWIGYTKLYRKDKVMVFLREEKEGENHDRETSKTNLQRRTEKAAGRAIQPGKTQGRDHPGIRPYSFGIRQVGEADQYNRVQP